MTRFRFSLIQLRKAFFAVLSAGCLVAASSANAASAPDVATMLINFSEAVPNLMRLVTALAYVMGFFFIMKGIMSLKQFGEQRSTSSSSHEHSLAKPLMIITVGALLLYLPASVQTGLSTFWTSPNPYGYLPSSDNNWLSLIDSVFMVIQLVGVIAFMRGLVKLTHTTGHGQPGEFAKAMAFIISGILCINMYQFLQTIFTTLGLTGFLPP